jgi:hypothetical protein
VQAHTAGIEFDLFQFHGKPLLRNLVHELYRLLVAPHNPFMDRC